ncbi:hypothetical protein CEP54_014620 [Fusarium duplospermum]|uniref:Uncharacterized protein n=1 Tax=Fusarium duplospermum TaxID=1325734 RepID=A0A428NUU4_9HYPO|nr:hypothetical protein CEP54_014620 [Fusarium duplospermum]
MLLYSAVHGGFFLVFPFNLLCMNFNTMSHNNSNTHTFSSPTAIRGGGGSGDKHYEDNHDGRQHERQDGSELAGSGRDDPGQYEPPVETQDGETSTSIDTTPASNCFFDCVPGPVLHVQPTSRSHDVSSHDQCNCRTCIWVKEVTEKVQLEMVHAKAPFEMEQGRTEERLEMAQVEMEQRHAKKWPETVQSLEGERLETK